MRHQLEVTFEGTTTIGTCACGWKMRTTGYSHRANTAFRKFHNSKNDGPFDEMGPTKPISLAILPGFTAKDQAKELRRLRSIERRMKADPEAFCACGNYYTSKRCIAGPACDLGHRS